MKKLESASRPNCTSFRGAILLVLIALLISCGGGGGGSSSDGSVPPIVPPFSPTLGSWWGDNISFTLTQGSLLVGDLTVTCSGLATGTKCSGSYTTTYTIDSAIQVIENAFAAELPIPPGGKVPRLKISGKFLSAASAEINVSWSEYDSYCDAWQQGGATYYAVPGAAPAKGTFKGLGSLPGSSGSSYAYEISRNGNVVVGTALASSSHHEAFKYSETGNMQSLGILSGDTYSAAYGLSYDGSIVVGTSFNASNQREAFRWTGSGGMLGLGFLPGKEESIAYAASGDGSVVVGHCEPWFEAFQWSQSTGMVSLGIGYPRDISYDGTVVVGGGFVPTAPNTQAYLQAVKWTDQNDPVGLGYLPGDDRSQAMALSADKMAIVGWSGLASGQSQAFRWTQQSGMVALGRLNPDDNDSIAYGVSQDGSVVVGTSYSDTASEAFIWTAGNGIQSLKKVLTSQYNIDLTGWQLLTAYGVSDDGKVMAGTGINPSGAEEAWVANLR